MSNTLPALASQEPGGQAREPLETVNQAAPGTPAPGRARLKRAGLLLLAAIPFGAAMAANFPICPSAGMLGIPCPGCGLTRATLAVFQGHISQALALHPLVFVLSPLYVVAMVAALVDFVFGPSSTPAKSTSSWIASRPFTIAAVVLMVLTIGVWSARFFGAFGGPVPVQSYGEWHLHQLGR